MKLYTWQQECLKAWEGNGCRGIVNVVTGAGKTVLALEAIRRFRRKHGNARIRIVVPTIPLAQQWQSALLQEAETEEDRPGFFGAGRRDGWDRLLMIYIINSARDHLPGHMEQAFALGQPVLLICDECHHYQSRENRKIFGFQIPAFYPSDQYACLGLSATPFGTAHDEVLIRGLGKEIYRYGFAEASADGIVSTFTVMETAATFLPEERRRYQELTQELTIHWSRLLQAYPWLKGMEEKTFQIELRRLAQAAGMDPSDPAVISFDQTYQPEKMTLRRVHLMVNPYEGTGKRLEIDKKRFRALQRRYGDAVKRYAAEKEEIFRQYREAAMEFAGEEFWRAYLGIQPEKNRKMKGEKDAGTGS